MRVLAIDVGAGTTDILLWDEDRKGENQTHLIVPSATQVVAAEISRATERRQAVVFDGPLMGGGANKRAAQSHLAQGLPFYATSAAAGSLDDDLEAVAALGVTLVSADEAAARLRDGAVPVRSGDVRFPELLEALRLVGDPAPIDGCALAVLDHGRAAPGQSDRKFRFQKVTEILGRSCDLSGFFQERAEVPEYFTRMTAAAGLVDPAVPLVMGDTGPAALWGAALATGSAPCLAINFGNSHTMMGLVDGGTIDGLFEHHTTLLDPTKMQAYIRRFASGELRSEEVYSDGGHGSIAVSSPFDPAQVEIVVTGPRRVSFASLGFPVTQASIHGDMMLTGCYGLLQGYLARRH